MASKSTTTDKTSAKTQTSVVDRRAIQERGQQILDSMIVSNDDKVIKAALGEARAMIDNINGQNSLTVDKMSKLVETFIGLVNKNQIEINNFGFKMLNDTRADLRAMAARGDVVIKLADETVGRAMSMAERVAIDQARNQATALDILADTKTGDYSETLKTLSAMMMGFSLLALLILKGNK